PPVTATGDVPHALPLAPTSVTVAPATGALERLSKTTLRGSMMVTSVSIVRPQPITWTWYTSPALPSTTPSPALTGGCLTGGAGGVATGQPPGRMARDDGGREVGAGKALAGLLRAGEGLGRRRLHVHQHAQRRAGRERRGPALRDQRVARIERTGQRRPAGGG